MKRTFESVMQGIGRFLLDKLKALGRGLLHFILDKFKGLGLTRKQRTWLLILFVLLVPVILYLGGFVGQIMYEHDRWVKSGGIASTLKTEYPNVHPQYCFHYALYSPYGHKGIQLLLVVAAGLGVYAFIRSMKFRKGWDSERQFRQSQSGTYGTSGWMESEEQQQVFETAPPSMCEGIILGEQKGKAVCLPTWTGFNRHIAVYGAPGVGKSRCFVINHILQSARRGESIVVTDSKIDGGLYATTARYLESLGYTVRIFNLVIPECSDSWNCLSEIRGDQARAQMFVDVIMKNTSEGKSDEFWMNCEKNLLQALVLFVSLNPGYTETQKNLGTVYDLLVTNSDDQLEAIFSALPDTHPAKLPYLLYKKVKNNGNVAGGIAQGLGGRLQVFQAKSIRDITSAVEIDLELPAKEKCAYFVTLSDQDSTYEFLSSLFFSFLFIDIARWADRYGGGICKQPVNFILDEFPNIGEIPDFERKLATIRSRHMNISIIFQNIAQLKNRYPYDVWTSILGDCDTQLFLGCTDELTAKHISDHSGIIGVEVESRQQELQSVRLTDYTPQYKATSGQGKRNLMNVDEVMRLPNRQEIVFLRSQKGLKLDKFDYSRHPDARKLKPCSVSDHIPAWRAARMAHAARGTAVPVSFPVPVSAGTPVSGNATFQPQTAPTSSPTSQNVGAPSRAGTRQRSQKPKPVRAPKPDPQNSEMEGQQSLLDGSLEGMFTEKSPKDV